MPAIRVAGVEIIPTSLASQLIQARQFGERLDPIRIQRLGSKRTADNDELLVGLGELDSGLRHRHRIGRPRKRDRTLQQRT